MISTTTIYLFIIALINKLQDSFRGCIIVFETKTMMNTLNAYRCNDPNNIYYNLHYNEFFILNSFWGILKSHLRTDTCYNIITRRYLHNNELSGHTHDPVTLCRSKCKTRNEMRPEI